MKKDQNVLGQSLQSCCNDLQTGFFRTGKCETGPQDSGSHTVCAEVTAEFLAFTSSRGNELRHPVPAFDFPGLKPGDKWCLCALRWKEALAAGVPPPVVLAASNALALRHVSLEDLKRHALDGD